MRYTLLLAALLGAAPGASAAPGAPGDARPHLAFVLLPTPALPRGEKVAAAFRDVAPGAEGTLGLVPAANGSTLELTVGGGGTLLASLMTSPVPEQEADQAFTRSYSAWLDEGGKLPPHRAHLVVFFRDAPGRSRFDELTRFTYLLAAVAQASQATAVAWGNAGATHEARYFVSVARERDPDRMLPLWCGFEAVKDGQGRASLVTVGMRRQLGIMELRVTAPQRKLAESIGPMYELLAQAARRGGPVPEGETVGGSAGERLKVRYERSPLDPADRVWRVDLR